ncbi:MAG: hypothetical protein MUC33_14170, partial [Desulfobacterales bacterium]|nr:hypothetical protein [Desulfobacterales bacterium]
DDHFAGLAGRKENIEKNVADGRAAVYRCDRIGQAVVIFEILNDGRTKAVISDQRVPASKNQAVILGERLEHVVQFMPSFIYCQ